MTTLVRADETKGGVTRERLRAAGTQYPAEVAALMAATRFRRTR